MKNIWIFVFGCLLFLTLAALVIETLVAGEISYIPWLWAHALQHGSGDRVRFVMSIAFVVFSLFVRKSGPRVRRAFLSLSCLFLAYSTWLLFEVILSARTELGWFEAVFHAFGYAVERVTAYLTPIAASLTAWLVVATVKPSDLNADLPPPGRR